jgi:hypothetical protein
MAREPIPPSHISFLFCLRKFSGHVCFNIILGLLIGDIQCIEINYFLYAFLCVGKGKVTAQHAMKALGGRGGLAPTLP